MPEIKMPERPKPYFEINLSLWASPQIILEKALFILPKALNLNSGIATDSAKTAATIQAIAALARPYRETDLDTERLAEAIKSIFRSERYVKPENIEVALKELGVIYAKTGEIAKAQAIIDEKDRTQILPYQKASAFIDEKFFLADTNPIIEAIAEEYSLQGNHKEARQTIAKHAHRSSLPSLFAVLANYEAENKQPEEAEQTDRAALRSIDGLVRSLSRKKDGLYNDPKFFYQEGTTDINSIPPVPAKPLRFAENIIDSYMEVARIQAAGKRQDAASLTLHRCLEYLKLLEDKDMKHIDKEDYLLLRDFAVMCAKNGSVEDAETATDIFLKYYRENPEFSNLQKSGEQKQLVMDIDFALGQRYAKEGDLINANRIMNKYKASNPGQIALIESIVLEKEDKPEEVLEAIKNTDPDLMPLRVIDFSDRLARKGKTDEALEALKTINNSMHYSAIYRIAKSHIFTVAGQYEKAIQSLNYIKIEGIEEASAISKQLVEIAGKKRLQSAV